jgi:hypothetical protein
MVIIVVPDIYERSYRFVESRSGRSKAHYTVLVPRITNGFCSHQKLFFVTGKKE